jgi:hypothetical protein
MDHSQINRGIRGLTYSYEFGGNIASYGFENHINLWCPEVILRNNIDFFDSSIRRKIIRAF